MSEMNPRRISAFSVLSCSSLWIKSQTVPDTFSIFGLVVLLPFDKIEPGLAERAPIGATGGDEDDRTEVEA